MIDGTIPYIGADFCPVMVGEYSNGVDQRLNATNSTSPVKITGDFNINGNQATLTAHFELMDPGTFTSHQATLFIYEDDITWCCGYGGEDHWDDVARMARSTTKSLTTVGQVETVVQTLNITGMNAANLHPAVIYEQIGGAKVVIQASNLIPVDYALDVPIRIASVPTGNGVAYFNGTVTNIGEVADVVNLQVDAGFGWPTDFQIEGDPTYYQNHNVPLAIGEAKDITVRVQTDGVVRIGSGQFIGTSQNTGHVTNIVLRVFNGSPAILLVDDDNNTAYETPFVDALNANNYLFDTVTAAGEAGMRGFDCVIWQTAYQGTTLAQADMDALMAYLDNGGRLFLSSMDFLSSVSNPNTFANDYLGVASWTLTTRAARAVGVGGDPITNGMDMALSWPAPAANRVDTVNPGAGAAVIFNSDTAHPAALRFDSTRSFRTVFNSIAQNAFPTAGADPNNSEATIEKTLVWLLGSDPAAVDGPSVASSLVLQTGPNPARGDAELRFALSASGAGDVRLTMVDAAGRQVRNLFHGPMTPGSHNMTWDRMDDAGHSVATGLYFVRLETADGVSSGRVVVLN